jgi:TonB family protein
MPNVLADAPLFAGWLPKRLADETGSRQQGWARGVSAGVHGIALLLLATLVAPAPGRRPLPELNVTTPAVAISLKNLPLVFTPAARPGGGGGGGGARQKAPVPKAHGRGNDPITLPTVREPVESSPLTGRELPFQMIDIPVKPLASGTEVIAGLPAGVEGAPPSRGPGSGGGVGDGIGTGAGSGVGSGLGSGTGGGMGGGVYRPGGGVTAPTLLTQIRPTYTTDALRNHIQGSVTLEAVVRRDGVADAIRVVKSLDSGLDAQAIQALRQWRFRPGRLGDTPVDVLVSVVIDFTIR